MGEAEDLRTFIREIMLRFDRRMEGLLARMDRRAAQASDERRRYFDAIRAEQKVDREKLDEVLAEGRAGRQALFHLLDRLDGKGGAQAG